MNTATKLVVTGVALYLLLRKKAAFGKLVTDQQFRACDSFGCGTFDASRDSGTRSHNGVDIIVYEGQAIKSPIIGTVVRYAYPYASDLSWRGLALENDTYFIKIYYMEPSVTPGATIKKGQVIGYAQDIGEKYPGITPHIHYEVYLKENDSSTLIDPTDMF